MTDLNKKIKIALKNKSPLAEINNIIDLASPEELNLKNSSCQTILNEVICCDEHDSYIEQVVSCLIERGADVNSSNNGSWTPLYSACWYGHNDNRYNTVRKLINAGADLNLYLVESPLSEAAHVGATETVRLLLSRGAKVNARNRYDGSTPLHTAIFYSRIDIIKCLISYGADVNAATKYGITPLHSFASNMPNFFVGKILLDAGADVNYNASLWTGTPLHAAAANSASITLAFLIENGADMNAVDNFGNTPLHMAVKSVRINEMVVSFLLKIGADPHAKDKYGESPLEIALKSGNESVIKEFACYKK